MTSPIRAAVVDRCPAVRAGVPAILGARPDLTPRGRGARSGGAVAALDRAHPDVVRLEHDPGSGAGLATCLRIKARPLGPRVILWAAEPGSDMIVPAKVSRRALDARTGAIVTTLATRGEAARARAYARDATRAPQRG